MSRPLRILALDDSLTMRKLIEVVFRDKAFELHLAETGAQAIATAARVAPDVVLMDYVLPDMKGTDICAALAQGEATRNTPVLVTSAKGGKILDEFRGFPTVVGYLPKPFKPAELKSAVLQALQKGQRPEAPLPSAPAGPQARAEAPKAAAPKASGSASERLARILYTALQPALLKLPEWLSELGAQRPDRFFATRLITPNVVQALLEAQAQVAPVSDGPPRMEGTSELLPVLALLQTLAGEARSGTLALQRDEARAFVFLKQGRITAATIDQPALWAADLDPRTLEAPPEVLHEAEEQQRRTAVPLVLPLAQRGAWTPEQLASALRTGTRSTLRRVMEGSWRYEWSEAAAPPWCEFATTPLSVVALQLEKLRHAPTARGAEPTPTDVVVRLAGFSERVRQLDLDSEERTLLTLVNDRNTLAEIAERGGLQLRDADRALLRLESAQLVARLRGGLGSARPRRPARPRVMAHAGPDEPLFQLLRQRWAAQSLPRELLLSDTLSELGQNGELPPQALLVDTSRRDFDASSWMKDVRNSPMAGARILAVVEGDDPRQRRQLLELGFDAVLSKPFLIDDLEELLEVTGSPIPQPPPPGN